MNDRLQFVKRLISDEGIKAFPLPQPVPGVKKGCAFDGKTPLDGISWKDVIADKRCNQWLIEQLAKGANYAIATGQPSGVVVVDADDHAAEAWIEQNLPQTPWMVETAKGKHYFFRCPADLSTVHGGARCVKSNPELKIDLRADGNYVVGPHSLNGLSDGDVVGPKDKFIEYYPTGDWKASKDDLPSLPIALFKQPSTANESSRRTGALDSKDDAAIRERAKRYVDTVEFPAEGRGSDTVVFALAQKLRVGFLLPSPVCIDLILERSKACGANYQRWWVAEKVDSAELYSGGLEAGWLLTTEEEPTPVAAPADRLLKKFKIFLDEEIENLQAPSWLVEDLVPASSTTILFGAPGSGKTFVALSWAVAVAGGVDWTGHRVQQGTVLYIYAEGAVRLRERLLVAKNAAGLHGKSIPLLTVPTAVDIGGDDTAQIDEMILAARELVAVNGLGPITMVVVDTLNRCFPGDENDTGDMTKFIRGLDMISAAFDGATMLVVHHNGWSENGRERGNSALRGASDMTIQVLQGDAISQVGTGFRFYPLTLECRKSKDGAPFEKVGRSLVEECVVLPSGDVLVSADGEEVTSCSIRQPDVDHDGSIRNQIIQFLTKYPENSNYRNKGTTGPWSTDALMRAMRGSEMKFRCTKTTFIECLAEEAKRPDAKFVRHSQAITLTKGQGE